MNSKASNNFSVGFILAISLFVISFWGVTYNSDWEGYEYFFLHSEKSPDYLFRLLSDIFNEHGYEYLDLYRFHICLMAVFFFFYISRFTNRYLLILLALLLFGYVSLGNQIRYYLAFPMALLSTYYWYESKRWMALVFASLAVLCHNAIIVFLLMFLISSILYRYFRRYFISIQITASIVGFMLSSFAANYIQGHFSAYFEDHFRSSLLGGLYSIIQYFVIFFIIINVFNSVKKRDPALLGDKKVRYLFILSLSSMCLLLASMKLQILANRYISSLFVVWIIFLIYVADHTQIKRIKSLCKIAFVIIFTVLITWRYILPWFLFGENQYILDVALMIMSFQW